MKRFTAVLLALVMAVSFASGCGNTSQPSVETTPAAAGEQNDASSDSGTSSTAKDTLMIAHYADAPNLDPMNSLNDCAMRITTNIYDPLIRMDKDFQPVPCLAESWEISDDGKEYTFQIRKGVKWHNGDELTVDDVVFSFERGMQMPTASPNFSKVESCVAVGDSAVKVTLKEPYNQSIVFSCLALPFGPIVNKKYVESMSDEEFGRNPMGTGPFLFKEWQPGVKAVMTENPDYFMGAPALKEITYVVIGDKSAALISLESGDIDAYIDIDAPDYPIAERNPDLVVIDSEALGYDYLVYNTARPPFNDVNVRRALAYAIDKDSIIYGGNGGVGTIIDTFLIPQALGFNDDVKKYPYDVEMAKTLLAEAGYPGGEGIPTIEFLVYMDQYSKYAQIVQESLRELGISSKINLVERAAYQVDMKNGNFDIIMNGIGFAALDLYEAVSELVLTEQIGDLNSSQYSNPRIDELFENSSKTTNQDEIAAIYREIQEILCEDVPVIPIAWRVRNVAANKDLRGIVIDPYSFPFLYDWHWV